MNNHKLIFRRKLFCSLVLLTLVFSASVSYAKESVYEQRIARGISAMEDKDYAAAIEDFRAALNEKPDDYRAALYLGISLSRLKHKDAEATLKKAYAISPNEARVNLELGVHYFNNNKYDDAKGYLNNAIKLSQDDELKNKAEEYLTAIGEKGAKKKWSLNIALGAQYDTNVILNADAAPLPEGISNKSDWRSVIELNGRYSFITGNKGSSSIGYSLYQSVHAKLTDFNISYHLADLTGSYAIKPYLTLSGLYSFEYVFVGSDGYDYAHSVYPSIIIAEGKGFSTVIGYRYKNKRFIDSETYQTNSDKNGSNHLAGITQNISYSIIRSRLGYAYDKDITKKDYWDYDGHKGFVDILFKLPYRFSLDLYGEYYYKKYSGINPLSNIERKDGVYTYSASLTKAITDSFDITISQTYIDNGSNIIYYYYNRAITGLFINVRF